MANLFRKSPEVKAVADALIEENDSFSHLLGVGMIYVFSSDVPTLQGRVSWGKATKISGLKALYARGMMGSYDQAIQVGMLDPTSYECFEIVVPKPIWDAMDEKWRRWLIRHQLSHCIITADEKLAKAGHDIELFFSDAEGIDELGLSASEFAAKFRALELAAAAYESKKAGDNGETNKPDKKSDKACKATVPMSFDDSPMCIVCGDLEAVLPPSSPTHCEGCSPLTLEERAQLRQEHEDAQESGMSDELTDAIRSSSFETNLPEAVINPSLCSVCFDLPATHPAEGPLFCADCRPLKADDINEAVAEREYERQMGSAQNPDAEAEAEDGETMGDNWQSDTPDYLLASRTAEGVGSGKDAEVAE